MALKEIERNEVGIVPRGWAIEAWNVPKEECRHEVVEKQRIRKLEQGHDMLTLISSKESCATGSGVKILLLGVRLKGAMREGGSRSLEGVTVWRNMNKGSVELGRWVSEL